MASADGLTRYIAYLSNQVGTRADVKAAGRETVCYQAQGLCTAPFKPRARPPSFHRRRLAAFCMPLRLRGTQNFVQHGRGVIAGGQREGEHQLVGLRPFP